MNGVGVEINVPFLSLLFGSNDGFDLKESGHLRYFFRAQQAGLAVFWFSSAAHRVAGPVPH